MAIFHSLLHEDLRRPGIKAEGQPATLKKGYAGWPND